MVAEHGVLAPQEPVDLPLAEGAWDTALGQTEVVDLLDRSRDQGEADSVAIRSGLMQLNRYLSRAWFRAGIPLQQHDDCSQAVYATLLTNLGRTGFDRL